MARTAWGRLAGFALVGMVALGLSGCYGTVNRNLGLVKDEKTGLMFGSVVEKNIITDASLFKNRKIKIRTRNTSGDQAFDLGTFQRQLETNFAAKGYEPVSATADDFGLLLDVNVMYSGHIETNLSTEFGFLGGALGFVRGAKSSSDYGLITGPVAGATIGAILGSFVTDDTYIIVSQMSLTEIKGGKKKEGKTITFSRSVDPKWDDEERQEKEERLTERRIKASFSTGVSAYAGGHMTSQSEIAGYVRERIIRIMSDII